jgi:hypothetical protein
VDFYEKTKHGCRRLLGREAQIFARPTKSFEILTGTPIDEDERTSPKNQIFFYHMSNERKKSKGPKTSVDTIHFLKVQVVVPESMMTEYCTVDLRPMRYNNTQGAEIRYTAYIRLKHLPFKRRTPIDIDFETGQSYHQDGVIDQTTCRIILVDPAEDREVVDLTTDLDNVKMENEDEDWDEEKDDHSPSSNQEPHSPPPLDKGVLKVLFFSCLYINTIYLSLHTGSTSTVNVII